MELDAFRKELMEEAAKKKLESKIRHAITWIETQAKSREKLNSVADAASFCVNHTEFDNDDLDAHWRKQIHEYKLLVEDSVLDVEHVLLRLHGLHDNERKIAPALIESLIVADVVPSHTPTTTTKQPSACKIAHASMLHLSEESKLLPFFERNDSNMLYLCTKQQKLDEEFQIYKTDCKLCITHVSKNWWLPAVNCSIQKRLIIPPGVGLLQCKNNTPMYFQIDEELFVQLHGLSEQFAGHYMDLDDYEEAFRERCTKLTALTHYQ